MRSTRCGWPGEESVVLSTHHTSQGWVRYRRCVCGAVAIELVTLGEAAGTTDTRLVSEPASAR